MRDELARLGYDPGLALAPKTQVYAENAAVEAGESLRGLLAREALDYGVACSETAFVAVRKEAGQVIGDSVVVANALPAGWSDHFVGGGVVYSPSACSILAPAQAYNADPMTAQPLYALNAHPAHLSANLQSPNPQTDDKTQRQGTNHIVLFSGRPDGSGEMILFDSAKDQSVPNLPESGIITRLIIRFISGAPQVADLDRGLSILLFIDDVSTPRAKVRLVDLLRQGGSRPINLSHQRGQALRIALVDPTGVWSEGAPDIEIGLEWA